MMLRQLRGDRLLLALTVALAAVSLVPLFLTPFLPLTDLGSSIGSAGLIDDILRGFYPVSARYKINPAPLPYWTGYAIMASLEAVFGALFAVKATVALVVVLLPLSVMRLMIALGRSPRLGLWAFLFAWDLNLVWGWFTFQLGMAIAFWALAWLIEAKTTKDHARIIPLTALVGLTHLHAVTLLGLVGVALVAWRPRAALKHVLALSGLLVLVPGLVARVRAPSASSPFSFTWHPVLDKAHDLFRFSLDTIPSTAGTRLNFAAFVLIGLAGLSAVVRGWRPSGAAARLTLTFLACALVLYLALPFAIWTPIEHWWTYPRYATCILIGLLLLPAPQLEGKKAWVLAPGIALVGALTVERSRQFSDYGELTRPYLEIVGAMRRNSTFLPLDYEFTWAGAHFWPISQMHGYAAAMRSSFDPHLFDHESIPVLFRPEGRPPSPDFRNLDGTFTMDAYGQYYDYLIVYPLSRDRIGPGDAKLLKEAGQWRLYEVVKKAAPPPGT